MVFLAWYIHMISRFGLVASVHVGQEYFAQVIKKGLYYKTVSASDTLLLRKFKACGWQGDINYL